VTLSDEQYQIAARAAFDQRLAARDYIAKEWPHNDHLVNDQGIEDAMLRALQEIACLELSMGRLYLFWKGSDALIPLDYGRAFEPPARDTAPWAASECDRCTRPSEITSALLIAMSEVIGLVLCEECTRDFESGWQPVKLIHRPKEKR
jgi:hypothetical protein